MTDTGLHPMWSALPGGLLVLLFAILPLEHTPGLRYLLCIAIGILGVWHMGVAGIRSLLRRSWSVALMAAWASASYFWSIAPALTLSDLKHDLWMPLLAFVGAYGLFRHRAHLGILLWAALAGSLANGFVILFGMPQAPYPLAVARYLVSTVAYASTCALYFAALALPWLFDQQHPRERLAAVAVLAVNIGVGLMLESRAFIMTTTLLFFVVLGVMMLRGHRRSAFVAAAVAITMIVAFAVVNRDRTALFTGQGDVVAGLDHVLTSEVRFSIWHDWHEKISRGPVLGFGYGRDVPAKALTPEEYASLASTDRFATMHTHNIFLNVLAETGWPGLILFVGMLAQCLRHFVGTARSSSLDTAKAGMAGLFLMVAMILKNQTDVLMVFGPAVMFYAALGGLLAWPRDPLPSS